MNSLPPVGEPVKTQNKSLPPTQNQPFKRAGIRLHDPSAASIGAATPSKQVTNAATQAIKNDPIVGGALPQNRIGRYTDLGLPDQT